MKTAQEKLMATVIWAVSLHVKKKKGYVRLYAGKACLLCGEKTVFISLSIIQSNVICQNISLGT